MEEPADSNEVTSEPATPNQGSNFGTPISKLRGHQELDVIDANTVVRRSGRAKPTRKHKPVVWSDQDDKLLTLSFLNVSKDPIVGSDNKMGFYWLRMAQYFNDNRNEDQAQREPNQCKQHWHVVNKTLMRFKECYSEYDKSGCNEEMKMENALQAFDNLYGKFVYQHLWYIVKDDPKWNFDYERKQATMTCYSKRMKVSESRAYTSSDGDVDTSEKAEEVEPISLRVPVYLEAIQFKEKNVNNDNSESISHFHFEPRRSSLINHVMLARELQVREQEVENQLLFADVTKMTSLQRKIHEKKLEAIAEKYGWNLDDN